MTGNSLDAVDVVLTQFEGRSITDICGHSHDIPTPLAEQFRHLKKELIENGGDIQAIASAPNSYFYDLHDTYIKLVATTVRELISKSGFRNDEIDIVGFHGQTCSHFPPSIAGKQTPYTLQIGNGQMLADLLQIPVAFDFRSDDLMNGGEAAPLAPIHNQHIAQDLHQKGLGSIAFCNGGNTGNIAIVNNDNVYGWDTGPFNHFIDYLARTEKNQACDFNGELGRNGTINYDLLSSLFNHSVLTQNGENFLQKSPPRSSDPAWYKIVPELIDPEIPFADRIRTAEFFSAYIFAYSLKWIKSEKPSHYLIFGGGWKNPLVLNDFSKLLSGEIKPLPEHQDIFANLIIKKPQITWADKYGYSGQYMEARIFADMAKCRLTNEAFSYPQTTGCKIPTIGGIIALPGGNNTQYWSRAAKKS